MGGLWDKEAGRSEYGSLFAQHCFPDGNIDRLRCQVLFQARQEQVGALSDVSAQYNYLRLVCPDEVSKKGSECECKFIKDLFYFRYCFVEFCQCLDIFY